MGASHPFRPALTAGAIVMVLQATIASCSATTVCSNLESLYSGVTYLPEESEYPTLRTENWSETAWKTPACIFQPENTEELQDGINKLVHANVEFAIRSGGHSPSPGSANIDGGILIDLAKFNELSYNAQDATVTVGTGQRWGEVYEYLNQFNVTVVGARVLEVGVGGFLLGAGLSYLTDLYGLGCDNVVSFEVVLANGSAVTASADSHPDLHKALKGGINNFGVVTSFTLHTYPIGDVWGGIRMYSMDDLPSLFEAMAEYQSVPDKDPYANAFLQSFVTNKTLGVALTLIYLKPEVMPSAFDPFAKLTALSDSTKISSFTSFMSSQGISQPRRIDWHTTTVTPSKELYSDISDILFNSEFIQDITSVTAGSLAFTLQPISNSVARLGNKLGGNSIGLSEVTQAWFVLAPTWWSSDDDAVVHKAVGSMLEEVQHTAAKSDSLLPYIFMNDASWDQEVIAGYGKSNVEQLNKVAGTYDPQGVFQNLVPGGFKLP